MDLHEYNRQITALGLHGPMGELRLPSGNFVLVYKMPDGAHKHLPPATSLTDEQRAEIIDGLKHHLGIIENNRRGDQPDH